jgi:hypothetical protein
LTLKIDVVGNSENNNLEGFQLWEKAVLLLDIKD